MIFVVAMVPTSSSAVTTTNWTATAVGTS